MDVQSAELAQNTAECYANLKQELVKAKRALDKLVEESAQRMVVKTAEVHNLNEEIRVLKEQNSEVQHLIFRDHNVRFRTVVGCVFPLVLTRLCECAEY